MTAHERLNTITYNHMYNLLNQGWPTVFDAVTTEAASAKVSVNPINYTRTSIGVYPSNADVIWAARVESSTAAETIGAYSPWTLQKNIFGSTPAAKGHFIINAFDRNRQYVSGVLNIYDPDRDSDVDRPVSVEFFAGRVWYLMPNGRLLFSQLMFEVEQAVRCYQQNDPTAEDINQLLADDGGELFINDIGEAYHILSLGTSLVVFADNGIWIIRGGNDVFKASDYAAVKVTDIGVISTDSIVQAEDSIFFWGRSGIYVLQSNDQGSLSVNNIARDTIQTFYLTIPGISRSNAKGHYDSNALKIIWLYNDAEGYDGITDRYRYSKALILDFVTGGFTKYSFSIGDNLPFICGMAEKKNSGTTTRNDNVYNSTDRVVVNTDPVIATSTIPSYSEVKLKLLSVVHTDTDENVYTFSEFKNRTFKDWVTFDSTGQNYTSYLETGNDIVGSPTVTKFGNWLYTFFERTETGYDTSLNYNHPSSCTYRVKWHWSDSAASNKWSAAEELYRLQELYIPSSNADTFDYGFEVVEFKSKLRGSGKAIRIRFDSVDGKDFRLLGWVIPYTGVTGA